MVDMCLKDNSKESLKRSKLDKKGHFSAMIACLAIDSSKLSLDKRYFMACSASHAGTLGPY